MMKPPPFETLLKDGLNLQAIFNLADLPAPMKQALAAACNLAPYNQLILIGHGGNDMWRAVEAASQTTDNPIDDFSVRQVTGCLERNLNDGAFEFVYPGTSFTGLQELGALAGWHNPSPLRIGINDAWGTWFAYRCLVLTASSFEPTPPQQLDAPCDTCITRNCIKVCPAKAVTEDGFNAPACFSWRASQGSACKDKCPARIACPSGAAHRYSSDQMAWHYGLSLKSIERMNKGST